MSLLPKDVIVQLSGGLGNQMFQYAAGMALARTIEATLYVDARLLDVSRRRRRMTSRSLELFNFDVTSQVAQVDKLHELGLGRRVLPSQGVPAASWALRALRRVASFTHRPGVFIYREPSLDYDECWPRLAETRAGSYLCGYWQSEEYFRGIRHQLRSEFVPLAMSSRMAQLRGEIAEQRSLVIHVRRGDYLKSRSARNFHGVLSGTYYRDAIRSILDRTDIDATFVFTEDGDIDGLDLQGLADPRIVKGTEYPDSAAAHLFTMTAGTAFIVANSSFSWWAAWLSQAPGHLIIGPTPWFRGGPPPHGPLPKAWARLDGFA